MFKTLAEELALKRLKKKQLLSLYKKTLTRLSNLTLENLEYDVSANFKRDKFDFEITVYLIDGTNKTLYVYEFWELEKAQKLVDVYVAAIKTDNFEEVKAARKAA